MTYPDTSFLLALYVPDAHSPKATALMRKFQPALIFTPLHRHELRNAIRLCVFRKQIDTHERSLALHEIDGDLTAGFLIHTPLNWTAALQEAEQMSAAHAETVGARGIDVLHVGAALALRSDDFLSFDENQRKLARAAGLNVAP
jgi:predicted nucleic acid-binding protein